MRLVLLLRMLPSGSSLEHLTNATNNNIRRILQLRRGALASEIVWEFVSYKMSANELDKLMQVANVAFRRRRLVGQHCT